SPSASIPGHPTRKHCRARRWRRGLPGCTRYLRRDVRTLARHAHHPALQVKREWSPWPEFGSDRGNPRELSKGQFATTVLTSNLTCPATQSALCGSYTAPQKIHDILHGYRD